MESELNGIDSKSSNTGESDPKDDNASAKDDRPLASSAAEDIQELKKKFAAFVRNDAYGAMGFGKLAWEEKASPSSRFSLYVSLCKCIGCVYVQRELKSSNFKGVAGIVTDRVGNAHQNKLAPMMMLFPEGTSNGDFLLPFKTGAFLPRAPVVPVILRYPYQRFSPAWDSMSGVRHVGFLLCQFVNHLEVTWLPDYHPSQQEKDNPKLYADNVRKLMASEGGLILSDNGLSEKRIYLAALNGNNNLLSDLHQKND